MANGLAWEFEAFGPKAGAASGAWRNPLAGSELPHEYVLSREAIQNSTDAQRGTDKVKVAFTKRMANAGKLAAIAEILRLPEGPMQRINMLQLRQDNFFSSVLSGGSAELALIEDWNTLGLGGRLREGESEEDRFRRLIFLLGLEDMPGATTPKGGSFGYGKTVYSGASDVRTVIYYSRFQPAEATEGVSSRLFVASFFDTHSFQGKGYTGRAWFGRSEEGSAVWPLEDDAADQLAEGLGFARRGLAETGLSLMILGSHLDMDKLRRGIEEYWWPRLIDDDLEIRLFEEEMELDPPRPRRRSELRPFLHCYELLIGRAIPDPDFPEKTASLRPHGGLELGKWAAVRVEPLAEDDQQETEDEFEGVPNNSVALIRRGPRMVVDYHLISPKGQEAIVGVFLGDPAVEEILRFSEPPSHDKWIPNNPRLSSIPQGQATVRRILARLKQAVGDFQKSLTPPPPPVPSEPLRALEQLLAKHLFGQGKTRPPAPPHNADPFAIQIREKRQDEEDQAVVQAHIDISLKQDSSLDKLLARVRVRAMILANDNRTSDEEIGLRRLVIGGLVTEDTGGEFVVELDRTRVVTVDVETKAIDRDWDAELTVEVAAEEEEPVLAAAGWEA